MARVTIEPDVASLSARAAGRIVHLISSAVETHGSATVCLTGGSTPERLYRLLASREQEYRQQIPWSALHLFWGDERHVPPTHQDSNYGMAKRALLEHVPVVAAQVHRMEGEIPDARVAAERYDARLPLAFETAGRTTCRFDVMLLGLGEDAHIASLFPASPLLGGGADAAAMHPRVAAVWAGHLQAWRITLRPTAILDAEAIVVLVAGIAKAGAVHAALERQADPALVPAHLLREADPRTEWLLDREAASLVKP